VPAPPSAEIRPVGKICPSARPGRIFYHSEADRFFPHVYISIHALSQKCPPFARQDFCNFVITFRFYNFFELFSSLCILFAACIRHRTTRRQHRCRRGIRITGVRADGPVGHLWNCFRGHGSLQTARLLRADTGAVGPPGGFERKCRGKGRRLPIGTKGGDRVGDLSPGSLFSQPSGASGRRSPT